MKPPRIVLPRAEPWPIGKSRNVERQIEADDRSAKIVGPRKEHVVHEFRDGPQLVSAFAAEPAKQGQVIVADGGRIVEEPGFVQLVAVAKLIRADAQTLRGVDGRFRIENECPFGWWRGLA